MAKKRTKTSSNVTLEKLSDLPFKSAKAMKDAQREIQLQIWRRLEEAKTLNQLLGRDEYKFWKEEFENGLLCGYGERSNNLVRVYSQGRGIQIDINKEMASSMPASESLLGALVKSMSESFATTYYRAKGILPLHENSQNQKTESDGNNSKN